MEFSDLSTVRFQQLLKPAALRIYRSIFPGCEVVDLRENGAKVHILDKEFGIDSLINLPTGQWVSIQEKYRDYKNLILYGDFTQEYMNGDGTPGEWFKLGAQLYFYGWANEHNTDFAKWILIDISKYKILVEMAGGLDKIGSFHKNSKYGRATFYSIPLDMIKEAIIINNFELNEGIEFTNVKEAKG